LDCLTQLHPVWKTDGNLLLILSMYDAINEKVGEPRTLIEDVK
jgi:hypothetical protein